ncbi:MULTISPECIES: class A beta-lactamase [unclassified Undibacterium]|uniref:class A beta-lactamase n=1 Tax=unclassified Undibacterium TaxID=2630295 RepID=UPI002AC9980B|nr:MULTISPECIES: class A beta-lactamase [unclassified Undibacterium]MEB0139687.1 class A beta-lactamase [Undibacterium sp. CCC2.1]MEB0172568.1 class A beta-lactamase [Undibacterium sp. CCC1.1]MEB0176336.1 class A beta-lactamase [Undibacterium sp. CCC3.4]MEB0215670.1 class A beta-lactamase [Undibacterium sp. 5I2]WPX42948.1 class A beta-lactamase [Undibacterium sp. CCC3.4]
MYPPYTEFSARRRLLLALASLPALSACVTGELPAPFMPPQQRFAELERGVGGRLGVYVLNTGNGTELAYRDNERFPLASTFKVMLGGAILERSRYEAGLLQQLVDYRRDDLVTYSPQTEKKLATGMTVAELCAAAIGYSDNSAANLLMKLLGGPAAVTAYARSIGDQEFRLDRWETELNSAVPGDLRDTTTPRAMATSLKKLVLGDALPKAERELLKHWLISNTTGANKIRAALPPNWVVGDKTGGADYGSTNDVAVIWPPGKSPLIIALYYTQDKKDAPLRDGMLVAATQIILSVMRPS